MQIRGSIGLITGGCQGFGKAFSKELLQRGAKVSFVDINEPKGKEFLEDCQKEFGEENVCFIQCDVTDSNKFEDAFEQTKAKFGKIDIVCNNAGGESLDWRKMVDLNLSSVIQGTYLGIKHMDAKNGGNGGLIINVGSLAGIHPLTANAVYTATKHGVVGFCRSFKGTLIEEKIRVNCLCPSFSPTNLLEQGLQRKPEMRSFVEKIGVVPIQDVANGFLELVNDDTRNGEVLSVTTKGISYVETSHQSFPVDDSQKSKI